MCGQRCKGESRQLAAEASPDTFERVRKADIAGTSEKTALKKTARWRTVTSRVLVHVITICGVGARGARRVLAGRRRCRTSFP